MQLHDGERIGESRQLSNKMEKRLLSVCRAGHPRIADSH